MRFRLKTHTFFSVSFSIHTNAIENGGACLRKRRFSKTLSRVEVFENGGSASCVDERKQRFSVDGKLFFRFQETENEDFRRLISVKRALLAMHFVVVVCQSLNPVFSLREPPRAGNNCNVIIKLRMK